MKFIVVLVLAFLFFIPKNVHAVPPPEFIIQITSQIAILFAWFFAIFLSIGGTVVSFLKKISKRGYIFIGLGIVILAVVAFIIAYFVDLQLQNKQRQTLENAYQIQLEQFSDAQERSSFGIDDNFVLDPHEENEEELEQENEQEKYIRQYYQFLSDGNIQDAYDMTHKGVDYATFYSWYKDTTKIEIEEFEETSNEHFFVRVALSEGDLVTHFGVLVHVPIDDLGKPLYVDSEKVSILVNGSESSNNILPYSISNDTFQEIVDSEKNVFVLDAREKIEYEYGHYPDSIHIKFSDLKDQDGWNVLPKDTPVFVICWSGIRGMRVADFLRKQGIDAYYLKDGAEGWVESGGKWEGEISFSAVYNQPQYQLVFTTEQYDTFIKEGVKVVDSRDSIPEGKEILGSYNIRLLYTATRNIDEIIAHIPEHSRVISVCDDYLDCFDARLIGVELERRGYTFLGRYLYVN